MKYSLNLARIEQKRVALCNRNILLRNCYGSLERGFATMRNYEAVHPFNGTLLKP